MNKLKVINILMILFLTTTFVGCSSNISNKNIHLTEKELFEDFKKMIYEETATRYEVISYLDSNISNIKEIEISSSMLNDFMYSLYENVEVYNNIVQVLEEDLRDIESVLKVEKVDNSMLSEIPKEYKIVKSVLQELSDNYLMLVKIGNSYIVDVDLKRVYEKYGKYMNDDTKKYLDFRIKEEDINVYNVNSDEYDIGLLFEITNEIYENLENMNGNSQVENWLENLNYYLEIVFSISQNKFLDEESKMLPEKLKEMKKESSKYTDTSFGKILNGYINILEKSDLDVNSDEVMKYIEDVYNNLNAFLVDEE